MAADHFWHTRQGAYKWYEYNLRARAHSKSLALYLYMQREWVHYILLAAVMLHSNNTAHFHSHSL